MVIQNMDVMNLDMILFFFVVVIAVTCLSSWVCIIIPCTYIQCSKLYQGLECAYAAYDTAHYKSLDKSRA